MQLDAIGTIFGRLEGGVEDVWGELLPALDVALRERGNVAWVVGGAVRDALLGRPIRDVDLVVASDEGVLDDVVRAVPQAWRQGVGRLRHDTVRIVVSDEGELHLDVTRMHGATLAEDLASRDVTINAMALPLSDVALLKEGEGQEDTLAQHVIDPLGGLADLQQRRLRLASADAFLRDPGRILRAARFLATVGATPTRATRAAAVQAAPDLANLHPGRMHEELNALFAAPQCAHGVRWLREVGALAYLRAPADVASAQETTISPGELDLFERSLAQAAALHPQALLTSGPLAPLAALGALRELYAQPLPTGHPRFVALVWSLFALALVSRLAGEANESGHTSRLPVPLLLLVPGGDIAHIAGAVLRSLDAATRLLGEAAPSLPELRRYFALAEGAEALGIDALVVAAVRAVAAAESAENGAETEVTTRAAAIIGDYFAHEARYVPTPLLTGRELVAQLPSLAGPQIGGILRTVRQAQLDGRITTRDGALAVARELAQTNGDA